MYIDLNECHTKNGGCEDQCINIPGSYYCSCNEDGYSLDIDKHSCTGKP